ncbi:hypothetical protein ABPG74_020542 [Tetrahymena malaccensis]
MDNKKTSVKVHNPPGGASNFTIGGGYEQEAPKKNVTHNANQESTETTDPTKTSVKVHQQPGGNSNNIFGGGDQPANNVKTSVKVHQQATSNIFGGYEEQPKPQKQLNQHQQTSNIFGGYEQQPVQQKGGRAQVAGQNQSSHNNIFGGYEEPAKKPVQQQQQQQQQAQQTQQQDTKTSVKVHNPPGGRSNFTLG